MSSTDEVGGFGEVSYSCFWTAVPQMVIFIGLWLLFPFALPDLK